MDCINNSSLPCSGCGDCRPRFAPVSICCVCEEKMYENEFSTRHYIINTQPYCAACATEHIKRIIRSHECLKFIHDYKLENEFFPQMMEWCWHELEQQHQTRLGALCFSAMYCEEIKLPEASFDEHDREYMVELMMDFCFDLHFDALAEWVNCGKTSVAEE